MWKDFFDKGKCFLGLHAGPWKYRAAGDCTQIQICERCKAENTRVEHAWIEWAYRADGSCDLARSCSHCAKAETRVEHEWNEAKYARAGACERVAVCTRCQAVEDRGIQHVMHLWVYRSPDECVQVESCSRCASLGSGTRMQHDCAEWVASEFYSAHVRVCRHCGEMIVAADASEEAATVSMQAVDGAVSRLIAAPTTDDLVGCLRRDSHVLMAPAVDPYFRFAFDQLVPDDGARKSMTAARTLIAKCHEVGLEAVIQSLVPSAPAPAAPPTPVPAPRQTASAAPATAALNPQLVGHWRHTEARSIMTIDTHCELYETGACQWWSKTAGGAGEPDVGVWQATGDELVMRFKSGDVVARKFAIRENSMLWPGDGRFRLWTRLT